MNDIEKDYNWEKDRTCIQRPNKNVQLCPYTQKNEFNAL